MSEIKFTPGPWLFSSYKSGTSVIVIDGKEFDVATVSYPNRDANAHLIAAAPDLYAALEELCRLADNTKDADYKSIFEGWNAARAALAKARGEA